MAFVRLSSLSELRYVTCASVVEPNLVPSPARASTYAALRGVNVLAHKFVCVYVCGFFLWIGRGWALGSETAATELAAGAPAHAAGQI